MVVKFFSQKKILFVLTLLFFLFFPSLTLALFENVLLSIPALIVATFLKVGVWLTAGIAYLMGAILDWIINPGAVSLSYTKPCLSANNYSPATTTDNCNPIIGIGFDITRSFVSLLLVVILIYIALSIALRLQEAEAKKSLVYLIIVALLVNFAPVLVGLIVDATNIVMNYFLTAIRGGVGGFTSQTKIFADQVAHTIWIGRINITEALGTLVMGGVMIIFNLAIAFAFFLFAGLFLFRYIAIWILVILSPIAFVAYILPRTRGIWNLWWSQLIQWSIFGIPISFFLYLGIGSFSVLTTALKVQLQTPEFEAEVTTFFDQIFPFFLVVILLYLGFFVGLSTTAMGSATVMAYTKTTGAKASLWASTMTRRLGRQTLSRITRGREEAIRKWGEKQSAVRMSETFGKGKIGKTLGYIGLPFGVTPMFWALRRGIGGAFLKLKETEEREVSESEKKHKGANIERIAQTITNSLKPVTERIGALRAAVDDGKISQLKEYLRKTGRTDEQIEREIISLMREGLRIHPDVFKAFRDAFPRLAKEAGTGFTEEIRNEAGLIEAPEYYNNIAIRIISLLPSDTIRNRRIDYESLRSPEGQTAILNHWTGHQAAAASEAFGKRFMDDFVKWVQQKAKDAEAPSPMQWLKDNNPALYRWVSTTGGRWGISL